MTTWTMRVLAAVAVVLSAEATGCALTSNAPPLDVRYFTVDVPADGGERMLAATPPVKIALGRVRSSDFLRNKIVYRERNDALGAYERWRWTEYPEVYLRRSLVHALFEGGRFVESLGREVPVLDVELVSFEEAQDAGGRAGRVQVGYRLRVGEQVLATDVVTAERRAPPEGGMAPVVDALEAALHEATMKIASAVEARVAGDVTRRARDSRRRPRWSRRS